MLHALNSVFCQAEALAEMGAAPDKVAFLDAPRAVLMERAQRRRLTLASIPGGETQCAAMLGLSYF